MRTKIFSAYTDMEPRKKYTRGSSRNKSKVEKGRFVGIWGMRAKRREPPTSTVISTFRREPMRSLTMPQKATDAMEKAEVKAFITPSWEAEKPMPCR